jgi:hypothetical protein
VTHDGISLEIQRATLTFNETEDRISLTCATKSAEIIILWLTARLAKQLVPHLKQLIDQVPELTGVREGQVNTRDAIEDAAPDPPNGNAQTRRNEVIGATAADGPVVAGPDATSWVINAIDVTNGPMLVQLAFRNEQDCAPALLFLEHMQLAKWLDGLKECFVQAGWSTDCWKDSVNAQPGRLGARQIAVH